MRLSKKLKACKEIFKIKMFGKRMPLAVTWSITDRCNFQCYYCGRWKMSTQELSTDDAMALISGLANARCLRIVFGGGEPLLRKDIGLLIDFCKKKGISTGLISNGYFLAERIDEIRNIDTLALSIDGIGGVCDFIRGTSGAYENVVAAIKIARKKKIRVILNTVLTRYNLDQVDLIIEFATKHGAGVMFGPVSSIHFGGSAIDSLVPGKSEFRNIIDTLVGYKKDKKPILNSLAALHYMHDWPYYKQIPCYAGRVFCHISANGSFYPCVALEGSVTASCLRHDFSEVLEAVSHKTRHCNGCWCTGTLEFNQMLSLKLTALMSILHFATSPPKIRNRRIHEPCKI